MEMLMEFHMLWNLVKADSFTTIALRNGLEHKLAALLQIVPGVVQAAPVSHARLLDEIFVAEYNVRRVVKRPLALLRGPEQEGLIAAQVEGRVLERPHVLEDAKRVVLVKRSDHRGAVRLRGLRRELERAVVLVHRGADDADVA